MIAADIPSKMTVTPVVKIVKDLVVLVGLV